ncbi:MAG TPA: carbon monoxide dehydrogenase subunit G [Gammaproteobacteria bacterium]|nr:carbon monoxide dehydrogenase subunit G [Gammaproteobacteria bacterium]
MKFDGSRWLAAPPDFVWDRLIDPEVLRQSIRGCESMKVTGEGAYIASLKLRFGPVSASFDGRLSLGDIVDNRRYTITFEGIGGIAGFGRGTADVRLEPESEGTRLLYTVEAQIGGKLSRVGQPFVNRIARRMIEDFFTRFERIIRHEAAAPIASRP